MFVRITLPAGRSSGGFCSSEDLRGFFRRLGFELAAPVGPDGKPSASIDVDQGGKIVTIPRYSEAYYRYQAANNFDDDVGEEVRKSVNSCGVYLGALSRTRAYVAVTRPVEAEITFFIIHEKLDHVMKAAEEVLRRVHREKGRRKIFDYGNLFEQGAVDISVDQSPKQIATATLQGGLLGTFLSDKAVELSVLGFTVVLLLACAVVNLIPAVPASDIDAVPSSLRLFADKAWPSLVVSAGVLTFTLLINFFRAPRKYIAWKWS